MKHLQKYESFNSLINKWKEGSLLNRFYNDIFKLKITFLSYTENKSGEILLYLYNLDNRKYEILKKSSYISRTFPSNFTKKVYSYNMIVGDTKNISANIGFEISKKITEKKFNKIYNFIKSYEFQKDFIDRNGVEDFTRISLNNKDFIHDKIKKEYNYQFEGDKLGLI